MMKVGQNSVSPSNLTVGASSVLMSRTAKRARDLAAPGPKALESLHCALEAHYADLLSAPLPGRLTELLARLETKDRTVGPRSGDNAVH